MHVYVDVQRGQWLQFIIAEFLLSQTLLSVIYCHTRVCSSNIR